ncbi:MAG: ABC transporter substrate-binding protein [Caldilineaceae bacterium]|nr:ABC transporter substrate-binding protein [Caldilineaceae bacterium]
MKKPFLLQILLVLVALLFAACTAPQAATTERATEAAAQEAATEAPSAEEGAAAAEEPVTISFWYAIGGTQGEALQALIDEFNASNPYGITVEATYSGNYGETATKVIASLESGDLPDGGLVPAGPLWTCREGNYLIAEYINGPEGINMDDYWSVLWDYNAYEGHICSLPFNNSTMIMYYNKDLMAAAGLDPEAPPQTWDELYTQAKAIVDADPSKIGVEVRDEGWWLKALILQNGGQIMNEDSSAPEFASEAGFGAMEFWKKLVDDGLMPPAQHGDSRDLFIAGQVGFFMSSTGNIGRVKDGAQFAWGTDFLPGNVARGATVGGAALVMFPSDQAHEAATWRFLRWLISPENSARFAAQTGYIPIHKQAAASEEIKELFATDPAYVAGFEQLEISSQYPHFWEMGSLDNYLAEAIEQMELDVLSPKAALEQAAANLNAEMGN